MGSDRDEYRGDVWYEEWRRGLPEGCISDDRIERGYDCDVSPASLVQREVDRRDARRAEEEYERAAYEEEQRRAYEDEE